MKKITILLLLLFFAVGVMAQMSTVNYTGSKPVPLSKNITLSTPKNGHSNFGTRSSEGSIWLNYAYEVNTLLGTCVSYTAPIFTDSSAVFAYETTPGDTTWGQTSAYSLGQTFNAYSEFFSEVDTISLTSSEGYTLDSISVPLVYTRFDPNTSIVDTLVINLFQGANKSDAFPNAYFTSNPDTYWVNHFGVDSVFFPELFYNYQTFGPLASYYTSAKVNTTITTIKVPLYQSDTTLAEENNGGKHVAIPGGGMNVVAGNLVGCTVAFKPGYTWSFGDTISYHYNSANFYSLDEGNSTGEPLYTPDDNNTSYIVIKENQYNQSLSGDGGWDSIYIPSYAFLSGYDLQDHFINYHITYNYTPPATLTIQPVDPLFCSGQSVLLSAPPSGSNYTWSPATGLSATTGDTVTASPTVTTTYYVTGLDSIGQTVTGTDVLTVLPSPNKPSFVQKEDTLISSSEYDNQWFLNGNLLLGDTNQELIITGGDSYSVTVSNYANGCSTSSDTVAITGGNYVWPGDANNDLVVNNYDLIPIGLYYGDTGIARDSTTNMWAPHFAVDWDSIQANGANKKYVDCNGDGVINSDDTLAVTQNYGLNHPFDAPRGAIERSSGTVPLSIVADSSSYQAGSMVHASVMLGSSSNPAVNVYGLAYDITFDASNVEPGTLVFNYNNASFMGAKNTNALVLTQLNNDVETAVTGIDHTDKTGYGKIGDLYFTLTANSNGQLGLSINSYEAVDAGGNEKALSAISDTVTVTTGISQLSVISNQLSVYPNPFANEVFVKVNSSVQNVKDWTLQITDELGQVVYKTNSLNYLNDIDMSKLPCAMYFISVISPTGSSVFPVIKQE